MQSGFLLSEHFCFQTIIKITLNQKSCLTTVYNSSSGSRNWVENPKKREIRSTTFDFRFASPIPGSLLSRYLLSAERYEAITAFVKFILK